MIYSCNYQDSVQLFINHKLSSDNITITFHDLIRLLTSNSHSHSSWWCFPLLVSPNLHLLSINGQPYLLKKINFMNLFLLSLHGCKYYLWLKWFIIAISADCHQLPNRCFLYWFIPHQINLRHLLLCNNYQVKFMQNSSWPITSSIWFLSWLPEVTVTETVMFSPRFILLGVILRFE